MTWGRQTAAACSSQQVRPYQSQSGRSSPSSTAGVYDLPFAPPFEQPHPQQRNRRTRAHSFSLNFFTKKSIAATHHDSNSARLRGSPSSMNDGTFPPAEAPPMPVRSSFTLQRKQTPQHQKQRRKAPPNDEEFTCCGLLEQEQDVPRAASAAATSCAAAADVTSRLSTSSVVAPRTSTVVKHTSAQSIDVYSTASSSHSSSASMTHSSGSDHDGNGDDSFRWEQESAQTRTGLNTAIRTSRENTLRDVGHGGSGGRNTDDDKHAESFELIDMDDLLDQTLMPVIMSPLQKQNERIRSMNGEEEDDATTNAFDAHVRQARSMPSLRAALRRKPSNLAAKPLQHVSSGTMIPFAGNIEDLRAQLTLSARRDPQAKARQATVIQQHSSTYSDLRTRRRKAPLTIEAPVCIPAVPAAAVADATQRLSNEKRTASTAAILAPAAMTTADVARDTSPTRLPYLEDDEDNVSEQTPSSALSALTMTSAASTLTEQSPRTPCGSSVSGGGDGKTNTLRARRSHRTLKSLQALYSPPPCPPPTTPLPDLPFSEGGGKTSYFTFDSRRSSQLSAAAVAGVDINDDGHEKVNATTPCAAEVISVKAVQPMHRNSPSVVASDVAEKLSSIIAIDDNDNLHDSRQREQPQISDQLPDDPNVCVFGFAF